MKITVLLDERLLRDAMRVSRARTRREVLERGLQRVLDDARHPAFVRDFPKFRLTWTRDELRRSRA